MAGNPKWFMEPFGVPEIKKMNGNSNEIIIICCYFGKLPLGFPTWLMSCGWNSTIDFLLVTDQKVLRHPENVAVLNCTLSEIRRKAQKELGFEPNLDTPYKLCDYKVIYGLIFKEQCQKYRFWGHCDMDMVMGDLRKFFTEDILKNYDRIYPYGHLALYRNTNECNQRFRMEGSPYYYRTVFTSPKAYFFDERCFMKICEHNHFPCYKKIEMADIRCRYKRFRVHECLKNYKHQLFVWKSGKVLRFYENNGRIMQEEFPYIHFKRRKEIAGDMTGIDFFAITPSGFIPMKKDPDIEFINKNNPYPGKLYEIAENIIYMIKTKIKHVLIRVHFERGI